MNAITVIKSRVLEVRKLRLKFRLKMMFDTVLLAASFRFMAMETIANQKGKALKDMNLEEMDAIWNEVKKDIR